MEELIETYRQAQQKYAQAKRELTDLQVSERELKGKINILGGNVNSAERMISAALTSESLEKARADVEAVKRKEEDAKILLSNTERAISVLKETLPSLHNDIILVEQDIWKAKQEQLIQEIKTYPAVLRLVMHAYVAAWQSGYRWEFEIFIREQIMNAEFKVDPDILAQFKAEMAQQIWPQSDIQVSN